MKVYRQYHRQMDTLSLLPTPSATEIEHSQSVAAHIAAEIERTGGWIPFDRYMQLVLYSPQLGYYAAGARKFGDSIAGGDFVTAPELSPLFAGALAQQLAQIFAQTPRRIVEFGAGSGALAADLIAALAARHVTLDSYSIIEVSPDLAERQRRRLQGMPVDWLNTPPLKFEGVMLANEVLDVMPAKLFVKHGGVVHERGVSVRDSRLVFDDHVAGPELSARVAAIEEEGGALPDGFSSEVNFVGESWMRSVGDWLARGVLLVIDYGFPRREYYHPQRLMGTIMCHFRHRAHSDPFWLPGLNDLTAHIDFSAMAQAAHDGGLGVLGYTSQARFLLNCGLLHALDREQGHARANQAHRLVSEAEMGELFKVLAVGRGIDGTLLGFTHGDRRHRL